MATTIEIVETIRSALERRDYEAFAACFHENGVYERPFALKGTVDRYEGADKIYAYIAAGMAGANKLFEIISVEVYTHACADADVIFAEFYLSGKAYASNEVFRIASSTALITCKSDKIINYRDFANSVGIAQAAGMLAQFAAALVK